MKIKLDTNNVENETRPIVLCATQSIRYNFFYF